MSIQFPSRHTKGLVTSPTRLSILQHLQMHGERTHEQLDEAIGHHSSWTPGERLAAPQRQRAWLVSHLTHLRAGGHIMKRVSEAQQVVWSIGTEPVEIAAPLEAHEPPAGVAGPRRVNVMHGPTYQPKAWAPDRAGAGGYAAIPSLMGSRRVAFRSSP